MGPIKLNFFSKFKNVSVQVIQAFVFQWFFSYSIITESITFFGIRPGVSPWGLLRFVGDEISQHFKNSFFFRILAPMARKFDFFSKFKNFSDQVIPVFLWQSKFLLYSFVCKSKTVYCIRPGISHSVLLQLVGGMDGWMKGVVARTKETRPTRPLSKPLYSLRLVEVSRPCSRRHSSSSRWFGGK